MERGGHQQRGEREPANDDLTEVIDSNGDSVCLCPACLALNHRRIKNSDRSFIALMLVVVILVAVALPPFLAGPTSAVTGAESPWERVVPAFEALTGVVGSEGWTILGILAAMLVAIALSAEQGSRRLVRLLDELDGPVLRLESLREYARLQFVDTGEFFASMACTATVAVIGLVGVVGMRDRQGWFLFFTAMLLMLWAWTAMSRAYFQTRPTGRIGWALARARHSDVLARSAWVKSRASTMPYDWLVVAWWAGLLAVVPATWFVQGSKPTATWIYAFSVAVPFVGLFPWWMVTGSARAAFFETGANRKMTLGFAMTAAAMPGALMLSTLVPALAAENRAINPWLVLGLLVWSLLLGVLLALGVAGTGPMAGMAALVVQYRRGPRAAAYVRDCDRTVIRRGLWTWAAILGACLAIVFLAIGRGEVVEGLRAAGLLGLEAVVVVAVASFVLTASGPPRWIGAAFMYVVVGSSSVLNLDRWTDPGGFSPVAGVGWGSALALLTALACGVSGAIPRRAVHAIPRWARVPAFLITRRNLRRYRGGRTRIDQLGQERLGSVLPTGCPRPGCGEPPQEA